MKGIDGHLPAKDFASQQRGEDKIKHVFCLCKPSWLLAKRMIDVGDCTSAEAIKKTDDIHRGLMTQKLRAAKKHKKLGEHWKLCP